MNSSVSAVSEMFQGFFYTVCPPAVMKLCEHADAQKKLFCTNLSAPFICEFFGDKLMAAMPYVDYLFGNETVALHPPSSHSFSSLPGSTSLRQTSVETGGQSERERDCDSDLSPLD